MAKIRVRAGFQVELVAAEPDVMDPVAIDWASDGSLWVAEMADYPSGMDGNGQPGGRIRRLVDRDGDGHFEEYRIFLDGISFPTGLLCWGRGVLVTAAPELFYAEDTDGDGVADKRETLFSGFLEGNQQLRVNGLRWGLDNWVYCASGSHHAGYGDENQIRSHRTGQTIALGSRDFRFRPGTGELEPQSGPSQFGRNRDDWGNWFGVQNSHPLWHYVLDDQQIRRNPFYAPPTPRRDVLVPVNPPVYPAKAPQKRFHSFDHASHFTSACSAMVYRDAVMFERGAAQHAFTCEPFHNLVQHNVIVEDGVSFRAYRDPDEGETDFFASADRWSRPVMVRTGPDGALWVVDMYRYIIEHPHWLPEHGQDELRPFFRSGEDRGRIYRVFPAGTNPRIEPLDRSSLGPVVAALDSGNGWRRDLAQRALVSAGGRLDAGGPASLDDWNRAQAVELLERTAQSGRTALGRLHALCTLDGLSALSVAVLTSALRDDHPAVRRRALQLSADRSEIDAGVLRDMTTDPDAKVRLELAALLGSRPETRVADLFLELADGDVDSEYHVAALMSSLRPDNVSHIVAALPEVASGERPSLFVRQLFGQLPALGNPDVVDGAFKRVCDDGVARDEAWRCTALADMLDACDSHRQRDMQAVVAANRQRIAAAVDRARRAVVDSEVPEVLRAAAVRLLFRDPQAFNDDLQIVGEILGPRTPQSIQAAAVAHAGSQPDERVAGVLLAGWKSHVPGLRSRVMSALLSRPRWTAKLLDAVEQGAILPSEFDASTRQRLLRMPTSKERANRLLVDSASSNRREVLARFQPALKLPGDVERGKELFGKKCATCHRQDRVGHEVGPNLKSITNKEPATILASILDPSAAVETKYLDYVLVSSDGRTATGMLATETATSITLKAAEGKTTTVLRSEIDTLQSTGKSMMPDGLEQDLSAQDIADVIEYVRAGIGE